ncbi:MAG: hypothetical protein IKI03_09065 [Clostridia bacterium]|nr:hypothetical protein [Clostridia bacterium]
MIWITKRGKEREGARFAAAGCPCGTCSVTSVWRGEDGDVVCPSYKKCSRYASWFSGKWREVTGLFRRQEK